MMIRKFLAIGVRQVHQIFNELTYLYVLEDGWFAIEIESGWNEENMKFKWRQPNFSEKHGEDEVYFLCELMQS